MSSDPRKRLVTVVVPVYNHARYIGQCLDSVFDQTHRPLQLIVIDDGSKDDSPAVIGDHFRRRGDVPGIEVVFRARENRGAHNTINEGLAAAAGEFIAILNSDDYFHPERLGKCVQACESAGADLVFSYVEPIADGGEVLPVTHPWRGWYDANCFSELAVAPTTGFVFLESNLAVSTGNLFFRRSLLEEVGPFGSYALAHDLDFVLRALLFTEPYLIREKLYFYRVHEGNTIQQQPGRETGELERIWSEYVRAAAARPPRNPLAPCHWYWPVSYERSLDRNRSLARGRDGMLRRPETVEKDPLVWRQVGAAGGSSGHREVTVITHQLSLSGAPRVALEVAAMLRDEGVKVDVISITGGPLRQEFESIGAKVHVLQTQLGAKLSGRIERYLQTARLPGPLPGGLRALAEALRGLAEMPLRYDILFFLRLLLALPRVKSSVFANSFSSWPVVFALAKFRSFDRMVWFIHESCDPNLLLPGRRLRVAFAGVSSRPWLKFAFGSDATRAIWADAGVRGVTRYWSGLPADSHSPRERAQGTPIRSVLSVGNSSGRKGTRNLIEAFALAMREGWLPEGVTLTVVGIENPSRNPYSADLVNRVAQAEFGGRVRLVPPVGASALTRFYEEADLYVQSSTMECLPLALLTAMAFGLPIVTTDVDGCKEAIIDGVCGRTIAPRGVRVLARAIADAVADAEGSFALGRAARAAFVERFSLEATESGLMETILAQS